MFQEIPASKLSISLRRPVHGKGINDAKYNISILINGKFFACPFYAVWKGILMRCFSVKYNEKFTSYNECTIDESWLTFSEFRSWMETQDWRDKQIDKDILIQGNKHYSPSTCIFVTGAINSLFLNAKNKSKFKLGVSFDKRRNKFKSRIRIECKEVALGSFDTEEDASNAYREAKYKHIKDIAMGQKEPLRSALLRWKILD